MFSEKDFERLWFFYKTEGEPKGVSINSFCIINNVPYTAFYSWFKKTQKKIVPVKWKEFWKGYCRQTMNSRMFPKTAPKCVSLHKGGIMMTIRTREGLCIQKIDVIFH